MASVLCRILPGLRFLVGEYCPSHSHVLRKNLQTDLANFFRGAIDFIPGSGAQVLMVIKFLQTMKILRAHHALDVALLFYAFSVDIQNAIARFAQDAQRSLRGYGRYGSLQAAKDKGQHAHSRSPVYE